MRRPALYRTPRPATAAPTGPVDTSGWSHPYGHGPFAHAVFYNDGGNPPAPPAPAPPAAEPPKPGPPANVIPMTQDELNAFAAKEKDQGKRAGAREALEKFAADHGFSNVDDAKAFIAAARQAQQDQLSEQEKREQALAAREQQIADREKAAVERERAANRRAVLVGLGATGVDLEDAAALLRVDDDADEATLTAAAEALKGRRPELFGAAPATPPTTPPAPGGAPAGGPPPRQTPSGKPGDRGREMARIRGHLRDAS